MLNWADRFGILVFLDNNHYRNAYNRFEWLLALNPVHTISGDKGDLLLELSQWHHQNKDWLFGHIAYDYKNILEPRLSSVASGGIGFPLFHFFCPEIICYLSPDKKNLVIESCSRTPELIWEEISRAENSFSKPLPKVHFQQRLSREDYLRSIHAIRNHIREGDCYELNFCSQGVVEHMEAEPLQIFRKLNRLAPAPFAAYYKLDTRYLICASPERYLFKEGRKIISQPIKGTAPRGENPQKDLENSSLLRNSIKETAENIMIVDLVRNDLALSCMTGSIRVEELFGIYSFPQVHQMISTVSGELRPDKSFTDAIRYSFPMGSMTGAPKRKVMELIDRYESVERNLFSGTVGYVTPDAGFDFNVIIRSLFYNREQQILSYQTGGAITYDSNPELEWEEMRLKALAMEKIFS